MVLVSRNSVFLWFLKILPQPCHFFVHVASRTGQDSSDNYNCIVDQSIYHSVSTEFYPVIIVLLSFDTFNIDAFRMFTNQKFLNGTFILFTDIFMVLEEFIGSLGILDII